MTEAYIYDAVRTPRGKGKKSGSLHEITSLSLATAVRSDTFGRPARSPAAGVLPFHPLLGGVGSWLAPRQEPQAHDMTAAPHIILHAVSTNPSSR